MKVLNVVGARPNFMKVAPLHRAMLASGSIESRIIHTGQHYDERMSDIFFRQLEMPEPDVYLGVGSGSHAQQSARVMTAFEEVLLDEQPDLVVVVGDVNSTLACALVAVKVHIPVAHVEAGLRSGDRSMPEEINRIVTDSIADLLFVTEQSGIDNLQKEGVPAEKTHFVGNVMIDSLVHFREKAARSGVLSKLGLEGTPYTLMTMHRPATVDRPEGLRAMLETIERLASEMQVVFPIHPRTRARLEDFGLEDRLQGIADLTLTPPVGYLEFLRLMEAATVVVTDSGGIQEETTFLGVPCITLRATTERPVTIELGTNRLMDLDPEAIHEEARRLVDSGCPDAKIPPLWDGRAAERIVEVVVGSDVSGQDAGTNDTVRETTLAGER